jgi:LysM repeat protein
LRLNRGLFVIVCCVLVAAAGGACFGGGGSSSGKAPDSSKIATATLPAKLPEPKILSSSGVQAGGGLTYTIKDGDTLAGIASRLGIALDDLLTANPGINPGTLRAGQSIKLPQNAEAPPVAAATSTPAKGSATAKAGAGTVAPKATAVPATSTEAPATATEAPAAATDTPSAPANTPVPGATSTPASVGQTYTVQDGDFPAKIAEKFGIPVEDLLAANPGINPTDLHIGDVIVIPAKRP